MWYFPPCAEFIGIPPKANPQEFALHHGQPWDGVEGRVGCRVEGSGLKEPSRIAQEQLVLGYLALKPHPQPSERASSMSWSALESEAI